jgi:acyl-CoA dehydrogenase
MVDCPIWPRSFAGQSPSASVDRYLAENSIRKLAEFFKQKGLAALKEEDRREQWHQDWLDYQAQHKLYASVLSTSQYSSLGNQFDLLKLTRFLEVFAYFSPSHGYSLQVSFLGLFSILMGSNADLKREAVAALEAGGLFAFGVSEKDHGSDLLCNEFSISQTSDEQGSAEFTANGRKYYIGNSNCAAIVSILAKKLGKDGAGSALPRHRNPLVLMVLRPSKSPGFRSVKKIRTLGVRSAFVGEFDVKDHRFTETDLIAEGRGAWDAVFGTVTLGKFFLGFGSIGICEHAMEEAIAHLRQRVLYHKPALEMPHIRQAVAQAYARLTAMKLYAYRALDYVHAASASDRRYLLYCAVQKARVSTEGAKVVAQLSECIGAKGFESETYFESAIRDVQLIPGLEGSTHINLGQTAQFADRYFDRGNSSRDELQSDSVAKTQPEPPSPKSLARGDVPATENPYLMHARSGKIADIFFAHFLRAYAPLMAVVNVRLFARQSTAFAKLVRHVEHIAKASSSGNAAPLADAQAPTASMDLSDMRFTLALGQCMATIAYAQLIAENALLFDVPFAVVSAIFHLLVSDLSAAASALAALPDLDIPTRILARRLIAIPKTAQADWDDVAARWATLSF